MDTNTRRMEVFFDVQRGLPRQGPGCRESTLKAFKLCSELPENPVVLDLGCGPGAQTLVLAEACSGQFIAVDTCDEYLDELRQRLHQTDVAGRIEVRNDDMSSLDVPTASVDLIWCEGAAYNIGVFRALEAWRPLIRGQGYLAFTELVWLIDDPVAPVVEFWRNEYPAMTSTRAIREQTGVAGYELIGDFTLPDSAWWNDYYTPLEAKLPALRQKYAADKEARSVIAAAEAEIDIRRRFGQSYGYQFFVLRAR